MGSKEEVAPVIDPFRKRENLRRTPPGRDRASSVSDVQGYRCGRRIAEDTPYKRMKAESLCIATSKSSSMTDIRLFKEKSVYSGTKRQREEEKESREDWDQIKDMFLQLGKMSKQLMEQIMAVPTTKGEIKTSSNRSRATHDVAFATAAEMNVDLIVAAESNRKLVSKTGWKTNPKLAIYFSNRSVQVQQVQQVKRATGYVRITLKECDMFCCYISPNSGLAEFKDNTDLVMADAMSCQKIILMDDMNAKSPEWGLPTGDKYITEWLASLNYVVINQGDTLTVQRRQSASYIDVTIASHNAAGYITKWEVLDNETMSDHRHIYFEATHKTRDAKTRDRQIHWVNKNKLREEVKTLNSVLKDQEITAEILTKESRAIFERTCNRKRDANDRMPFW
nr:unnamed protein product [Callosobruchus analis]